jgi:hypothetical protein
MGKLVVAILLSSIVLSGCKSTKEYVQGAIEIAKTTASCIEAQDFSSGCRAGSTANDEASSGQANTAPSTSGQGKANSKPNKPVSTASVVTPTRVNKTKLNLPPFPSRKNIGNITDKSSYKLMTIYQNAATDTPFAMIYHVKGCELPLPKLSKNQSACEITLSFIDENGSTEESEPFLGYKNVNFGIKEDKYYGTSRVFQQSIQERIKTNGETKQKKIELAAKTNSQIANEMSSALIDQSVSFLIRIPETIIDEKFSAQRAILNKNKYSPVFQKARKRDHQFDYAGYNSLGITCHNFYPGFSMRVVVHYRKFLEGNYCIDDNFDLTPKDIFEYHLNDQSIVDLANSYTQHTTQYFNELNNEISDTNAYRLMLLSDFIRLYYIRTPNYPEVFGYWLQEQLKVRNINNSNVSSTEQIEASRTIGENFLKEYRQGKYPSTDITLFNYKEAVLFLRSISRLFQPLENSTRPYDTVNALYTDWESIHYLTVALKNAGMMFNGGRIKENPNIDYQEYLQELGTYNALKQSLTSRLNELGQVITCASDNDEKLPSCQ